MKAIILVFLVLFTDSVHAASIQYRLDTKVIVGVTNQPANEVYVGDQYGVLTVPEAASAVAWPVPPGCPTGRAEWTLVNTSTTPHTLIVNPALVIFQCTQVTNRDTLQEALSQRGTRLAAKLPRSAFHETAVNWSLLVMLVKCPTVGISPQCDQQRTVAQQISDNYIRAVTRSGALAEMLDVMQQATDLENAQGW